jgi:hypothetical protein
VGTEGNPMRRLYTLEVGVWRTGYGSGSLLDTVHSTVRSSKYSSWFRGRFAIIFKPGSNIEYFQNRHIGPLSFVCPRDSFLHEIHVAENVASKLYASFYGVHRVWIPPSNCKRHRPSSL